MKARLLVTATFFSLVVLCASSLSQSIREPWPCDKTYYLYRANLHSHTEYSDGRNLFGNARESTNPWTAFEHARGNLDVLAVTDHGEHLTSHPWMEVSRASLANANGVDISGRHWDQHRLKGCIIGTEAMRHYCVITDNDVTQSNGVTKLHFQGDGGGQSGSFAAIEMNRASQLFLIGKWDDLKKKAESFSAENPGFIALAGFEWTDGGEFDVDSVRGTGHINIFGSDSFCGTKSIGGGQPPMVSSLQNLYNNWIPAAGQNVVCQFNHPSLYDFGTHFNDFSPPSSPTIQQRFALIELFTDGGTCHVKIRKPLETQLRKIKEGGGDGKTRETSNEYWFRQALINGWRVAPTDNGDNHLGDYAGEPQRTGIWIDKPNATPEDVLATLRARRCFAVEEKDWIVEFSLRTDGSNTSQNSNGVRIASGFQVEGSASGKRHPMGAGHDAPLPVKRGQRLVFEGQIRGKDSGKLRKQFVVVRCSEDLPPGKHEDFEKSGHVRLIEPQQQQLVLKADELTPGTTYAVYLRGAQANNDGRAYSAPIWIQLQLEKPAAPQSATGVLSHMSAGGWLYTLERAEGDEFAQIYRAPLSRPQEKVRLTSTALDKQSLFVSNDGSFIAFDQRNVETGCDIYRINTDGSGLRQLTSTSAEETGPCIQSSGRTITYFIRKPDQSTDVSELWIMLADGTGKRSITKLSRAVKAKRLADNLADVGKLFDSRKGLGKLLNDLSNVARGDERTMREREGSPTRVYFASRMSGKSQIYRIMTDGTGLTQLTSDGENVNGVGYVTSYLYFSSNRTGAWEIWRLDLRTAAELQLTRLQRHADHPTILEDGRVLFRVHSDERIEEWIMNADGSEPRLFRR